MSPHEKHNLLVTVTSAHLDAIVELGFREATVFCKELLHIPTIQSPLALIPLGASPQCTRPKTADRTLAISDSNDDINSDSSMDTDSGGNNNSDDNDASPLLDSITGEAISRAVTQSTMRYAALCEDYDHVIADIPSSGPTWTSLAECVALEDLKTAGAASNVEPVLAMAKSALFNDSGKLSIPCILNSHKSHQSETKVHSESIKVKAINNERILPSTGGDAKA